MELAYWYLVIGAAVFPLCLWLSAVANWRIEEQMPRTSILLLFILYLLWPVVLVATIWDFLPEKES